jgi:L-lactate utilization protein LutB
MLPTYILEPSPTGKRRAYAQSLSLPKTRPFSSIDELSARLKAIRQGAVADLNLLEERLVGTLRGMPEVDVVVASETQQALRAFEEACESMDTVVINQSSVAIHELAPSLRASGFRVVESYSGEFPPAENRFAEYRDLPRATGDHLAESFGTSDLVKLRRQSVREDGVRDMVALIGVNAVSADDGSIFLLQHSRNISKVYQQARKLVLLVAVDKIVANQDDARLQTLGMGVFGWEARLPNMGRASASARLGEYPFLPASDVQGDVTVIVLDNGRKALLTGPYRDLLLCIGCRACVRSCPTGGFMEEPRGWSPKEYLYYFIRKQNPSLDLCLNCGMCRVECPLDIDLPGMMTLAKSERGSGRHPAGARLADLERLGRWGSRMPRLANLALGNSLSRRFADRALGISREAPLPTLHGDTFKRWLDSRHPTRRR